MPGGDFSPEAYEQLREAYAKESSDQRSVEEQGKDIMGLNLGLETAPIDSPWADKIENWSYPSGKSQYLDEHQDPAEILQIMRDAAQERIDAKKEEPEVEEEEEDEESSEETEVETEEDEESPEETEEEDEEDGDEDEEDEEDEEAEEDQDDSDESEDEETPDATDDVADADDPDPEIIAAQIAELRAEIEQMQFVTDDNDEQ